MTKLIIIFFVFIPVSKVLCMDSTEVNEKINFQAQKFKYILEKAYYNYSDSIDIEKTAESGFKYMLEQLDIQSKYYPKDDYLTIKESNTGSNTGPGINIIIINDTSFISNVIERSPAEKAGLKTGDKIIYINGENVIGHQVSKLNSLLTGPKGSKLTILIKRGADNILHEFVVERQETPVSSILASFLIKGTKTGYIKIRNFSFKSEEEFNNALTDLIEKKIESLIIDLRGNPGGAITDATEIAGNFITGDRTITTIQSRNNEFRFEYKPKKSKGITNLPIVVIVDEYSASASEILSGALQDFDRAIVIGSRTFGKGSVQKFWEFKDGSAFRLTVGHYTTPLGRKIEKTQKQKSLNSKDLNNLVKDLALNGSLKTFTTPHKRIVLEGGGVIPDIFFADDTSTALTNVLKNNFIINEYVYSYVHNYGENLKKEYNNDINKFIVNFKVTDLMLNDLKKVSLSRNIWNEPMFNIDKEYIGIFVKATIAQALWNNKAFYPIYIQKDKAVEHALEYMPEAAKLIKKLN